MAGTSIRFTVSAVAAVGLLGTALAHAAGAGAAPVKTGGYDCIENASGAAAGCDPAAAPVAAAAAGVPLALPGPIPAGAGALAVPVVVPPVPAVVPPVPVVVPPVPVAGAAAVPLPLGGVAAVAPLPVGAPVIGMSGVYGGKGTPTGPPPAGAPVAGQPLMPGPAAR
jgi:hypothetical protein